MEKFVKIGLSLSLVISLAQANDFDQDFSHEFDKMQSFFNTVMNSNLKKRYFDNHYPKIDMQETTSSYTIFFNIAGVDKKDIKLTLNDNNVLKLEGHRKEVTVDKNDGYLKQEMFYGKFQRSVKLPQNINPLTLKTKYENGILKVTINKKMVTSTKEKVIPIN